MTDPVDLRRLQERVERPLRRPDPAALLVMVGLSVVVAYGILSWVRQPREGLGVTGLNDSVVWGLYIATFVFFIGISMAGTLISAILRLGHAEWRRPITRVAEIVTVASLLVSLAMITADMGRPDRLLSILWNGNLRSPIVWDVLSITTYLIGSLLYVGLPLIPDLALMRDAGRGVRWQRAFYRIGSFGWTGHPDQHRRLERAIAMTALIVIPAAIAVHSVTAWLFGMTLREGWSSPLMAPYFVASALFSGTAVIILVLALIRRVYGVQDVITAEHLRRLGSLLLLFGLGYAYLTFAEYLTGGYKMREGEGELLLALVEGRFAGLFWTSVLAGTVIPVGLLASRVRSTRRVLVAAALVVGGMMVKRFLIVVPSLGLPLMPVEWAGYTPTLVEVSIVAAGLAAFVLIIMVFCHLVPIISVTEVAEGIERLGGGQAPPAEAPPGPEDASEPRSRSQRRTSTRVAAGTGAVLLVALSAAPAIGSGSSGGPAPEQIVIAAVVRDVLDRPLPGALVKLVLDVRFFGEDRAAVVDERRTDQQGRVTLRWVGVQPGRTQGRIVFDGAAIWNGSERPVIFEVDPAAAGTTEAHRGLWWIRAELVLVPVLIIWGLLGHAAWTGLRIGRLGRGPAHEEATS